MMKKVFLFVFFLTTLFSLKAYEIKVSIEGTENQYCRLAFYYGDKQLLRDSTLMDNKGVGVFQKDEVLENGIYLIVLPNNKYLELLIDDTDQDFSLTTDTTALVDDLKVKNASYSTTTFVDYIKYLAKASKEANKIWLLKDGTKKEKLTDEERKKISLIDKDVKEYKAALISRQPTSLVASIVKSTEEITVPKDLPKDAQWLYFRNHYFDNINFAEVGLLRTPIFDKKFKYFIDKLNYQIPDSMIVASDMIIGKAKANKEVYKYVVSNLTNKFANSKNMGMDEVFHHLGQKYYLDQEAWWVDSTTKQKIYERVIKVKYNLIGNRAVPFSMVDLDGIKHKLYDVQAEYTILVFWSSSCGHCKKTMPLIKDIYEEYRDRDVKVVGVNIDKKEEDWRKYLEKNDYDWLNLWDGNNLTNFRTFYNVDSTPIIYVLDQQKTIIAKRIDPDTLEKILEDNIN